MADDKKPNAAYRHAMRERGYSDGRAGRERISDDSDYRVAWRRGQEARIANEGGTR